jgi:hypothetical protein
MTADEQRLWDAVILTALPGLIAAGHVEKRSWPMSHDAASQDGELDHRRAARSTDCFAVTDGPDQRVAQCAWGAAIAKATQETGR